MTFNNKIKNFITVSVFLLPEITEYKIQDNLIVAIGMKFLLQHCQLNMKSKKTLKTN